MSIISKLFTLILPDVKLISPVSIPIVVVFPAPFGPSSPKNCPLFILRLIPFNAWVPLEYVFLRHLDEIDKRILVDEELSYQALDSLFQVITEKIEFAQIIISKSHDANEVVNRLNNIFCFNILHNQSTHKGITSTR
mgnify:CR=1 FL=1